MNGRLLSPRWLIAHLVVALLAVAFIMLGSWQLSRADERKTANSVTAERYGLEPEPLQDVLAAAEGDWDSIEYRRVLARGVFQPNDEVLIRSQVHLGSAGFHVLTPMILEGGEGVLVNRGWIPLGLDAVPVEQAPPPTSEVVVEGWVQLSQQRPALGPQDPTEGRLTTLNRVDIERIQGQIGYPLSPVYLVAVGPQGAEIPVPLVPPDFADEGPHLAYAIQWFGFAVVLCVGYFFLVRRRLATGSHGTSGTPAKPSTIS